MQDKLDKLIKSVYRAWRRDRQKPVRAHPDEEDLVCFLEGRLSSQKTEEIKEHLLNCDSCSEAVAMSLKLKPTRIQELPQGLMDKIKELIPQREDSDSLLEIWLAAKEKVLEIINTTGDVLVGQEFVPAPILRTRSIRGFKDEVTILKDFKDIRIEVKIENKGQGIFNLVICAKQRGTQKVIKDLRVSLIRDDLELESYLTDSGVVTFEHVTLGRYKVELTGIEEKVASILLDIKA